MMPNPDDPSWGSPLPVMAAGGGPPLSAHQVLASIGALDAERVALLREER